MFEGNAKKYAEYRMLTSNRGSLATKLLPYSDFDRSSHELFYEILYFNFITLLQIIKSTLGDKVHEMNTIKHQNR